MNLKDLQKSIEKKCKGMHVSVLSDSKITERTEQLTTPAHDLNRIISGSLYGGLPSRTLTMFVGPEASGKSSFMALCAANAQKLGYTPIILDTEGAWDNNFVARWGIDPTNSLYIYCPWVDKICVTLGQLIESGEQKFCIILDSIGGLDRYKLVDDAMAGDVKADQGSLQKEIKRMLKMLLNIAVNQDSIIMTSGHYYGNPSGYGDPDQIGGGKFAKLAPHIIIALKKTKIFDSNKHIIGQTTTAITLKNRFYPPFNEAKIEIDYKDGINKLAGMVDLAIECGLIEKGGAWYTNILTNEKFQGEKNAVKCITKEVLDQLDTWIKETGYSKINEKIKEQIGDLDVISEEELVKDEE